MAILTNGDGNLDIYGRWGEQSQSCVCTMACGMTGVAVQTDGTSLCRNSQQIVEAPMKP